MSVRYSTVYIAPMDPVMRPEAKKAMDARLARIEGQVRAVRRMIEEDRTCENIAQQLSAARRRSTGRSTRWCRA